MANIRIIIVNYRTGELVVDLLRSIAPELALFQGAEAIIVDNASGDNSVEVLEQAIAENQWQSWVTFLPLPKNIGFGAGNNVGFRHLSRSGVIPDYFLLLNPDTYLRPGAIGQLLRFAQAHPEVGIAGSRLEFPEGGVQVSAFRYPSLASEFESGIRLGLVSKLLSSWIIAPPASMEPHRTDWIAGASMLIRRQVIEQVGMFDEKFFLYFEEVDFCRRAASKNWQCWYVPQSRMVHLRGRSTGVTVTGKPGRRPQYWFESRQYYFIKHHGRFYCLLADLAWIKGYVLWRIRVRLQHKPDLDPPFLLGDFVRNSLLLKVFR